MLGYFFFSSRSRHTRCSRDWSSDVCSSDLGTASTFGAHSWDAGRVLEAAIPAALKKAQPGTAEFRAALRDALEQTKDVAGAHGIFNMTPTDHLGLDQRAAVMVKIENGTWKYQP